MYEIQVCSLYTKSYYDRFVLKLEQSIWDCNFTIFYKLFIDIFIAQSENQIKREKKKANKEYKKIGKKAKLKRLFIVISINTDQYMEGKGQILSSFINFGPEIPI